MTLIEQIQNERQAARLAKDEIKSGILTVLVGEIERLKGKEEITNERVIRIIKSMMDDNKQVMQVTGNSYILKTVRVENEVLEAYLPKQLTEREIERIIASNALTSLKDVMQHFKANCAGRYDGNQVKETFMKER